MPVGKWGLPSMTMLRCQPWPALALTHVVKHRDAVRRLHDAAEAAAERGSKLGQSAGQTAVIWPMVLRTIIAIDVREIIARRSFRASRRGRRIVFPARAGRRPVLARLGRLQQGEMKFPLG